MVAMLWNDTGKGREQIMDRCHLIDYPATRPWDVCDYHYEADRPAPVARYEPKGYGERMRARQRMASVVKLGVVR